MTGAPLLALAAFVALTLVLAADYNATELYREARAIPASQPPATGGRVGARLEQDYRVVFGPLDRCALRGVRRRARFDGRGGYDRFTVTRVLRTSV